MARYFFDVKYDELDLIDEDGGEFDSLLDVEQEAIKAATELALTKLPLLKPKKVIVAVRDDGGDNVLSVSWSLDLLKKT